MTNRPRRTYAKTAERRQMIIEAAAEVFATDGFRGGSLRDIADRAGITHAGVMHHFPTKVHLLKAVLAWRDEEALARARAVPRTGVDVLRVWLDEIERHKSARVLADLAMTVTAEGTSPDHPFHDYAVDRYELSMGFLTKAFEVAASRGEVRPGLDPAYEARTLLALTEGLQLQWLLDSESVDMTEHLRRHLQGLLTVEL